MRGIAAPSEVKSFPALLTPRPERRPRHVAAVPKGNKETFIKHAKEAAGYFKKLGATRNVECWGDDVPKGGLTDFYKATQAKDDELAIFS